MEEKEGRGGEWRKRKKQAKKRRSLVTWKEKDKEVAGVVEASG